MGVWDQDLVLGALEQLPDPLGSLVKSFPGREEATANPNWIEPWFLEQINAALSSRRDDIKLKSSPAAAGTLSLLAKPPVAKAVRLKKLRLNYFRGFRLASTEIDVGSDLVMIEGLNSTGKTSISEALEWILTGELSRRTGDDGHARELANCIGNHFRPAKESTWVELILEVDGQPITLRRQLVKDYSAAAKAQPTSKLYQNGHELTSDEEKQALEDFFAGVAPILMQHTLRQFVYDDPTNRRRYFERLLQIDQLTALIERAVVGDAGLAAFPPPGGAGGLQQLETFHDSATTEPARGAIGKVRSAPAPTVPDLRDALARAAEIEFPGLVSASAGAEACRAAIEEGQATSRGKQFPLLEKLRLAPTFSLVPLADLQLLVARTNSATKTHEDACAAAQAISGGAQTLATALKMLADAGVVVLDAADVQQCALCADIRQTLTRERIDSILAHLPLTNAVEESNNILKSVASLLVAETSEIDKNLAAIAFKTLQTKELDSQLAGLPSDLAEAARKAVQKRLSLASHAKVITDICRLARQHAGSAELSNGETNAAMERAVQAARAIAGELPSAREAVSAVEALVGTSARRDPDYMRREQWLGAFRSAERAVEEMRWVRARGSAQDALVKLREGLIALRTAIIEDARSQFSAQMTAIWGVLRKDVTAQFTRLTIPAARGKGYKLEFEVKASIAGSDRSAEVDALRVFSESQINVVGIAAYVTRARLLGHKTLVFDDPVQSMDEEHFRTFAGPLIDHLISEGFQVVILTHSETFQRLIADQHFDKELFHTINTRNSKKKGCWVEEGNRRVSERLATAKRLAEDGRLEEAWRFVRLAMERLYLLAQAKAEPGFDTLAWRNATAEDMWKKGVEDIVRGAKLDVERFKEILRLTATGAHDKKAGSLTDVLQSIEFLRAALGPLRVGSG